jgi:hypothetical protein
MLSMQPLTVWTGGQRMMRKIAIAAAIGFAIATPLGASAEGQKVKTKDIPVVKHYDKASPSLATRDASTGLPSGKRSHGSVKATAPASSKPAARAPTTTGPSPQPLPYPNANRGSADNTKLRR